MNSLPIPDYNAWVPFDRGMPSALAMVIYYIPDFSLLYRIGIGSDYEDIKKEYPSVSHWIAILNPPAGN